jgi:hypothetical protein
MNPAKKEFESAESWTLMSTIAFQDWYFGQIKKGLDTYMQSSSSLSDNREFFKNKLGKQDFCTSDSANRRLYVWKQDADGVAFWILTACERGTTYEFESTPDTVEQNAAKVINKLIEIFEMDLVDELA